MAAVWKESKAEGRARLVLLAIADHQGEIGAWPSIATIAKMVNSSERSVKRDIAMLQQLGELEVHLQQAPSRGQYKTNLYWVILPSLFGDESGVTDSASGVTESTSGVTDSASGVTAGGTLTITNLNKPLLKPKLKKVQIEKELDTDFSITDEMRSWAKTDVPGVNVDFETANFKDYWQSAVNNKKKDWVATWRNWMRNEYKNKTRFQPATTKTKTDGDF